MKYRYLLAGFFLFFCLQLSAQSLTDSYEAEQDFRKHGMMVLGSWATLNIAGGLIGRANTTGSDKYFYEMNAIWNGVNLGIAALGYYGAVNLAQPETALDLYKSQMKMDKTLLFNAGLDLAYMAGGFYLMERSRRSSSNKPERLKGYGQSVILQGAFLLAFDLAMVLVHRTYIVSDNMILSFQALPGGLRAMLTF
jgi:hypothetical protein